MVLTSIVKLRKDSDMSLSYDKEGVRIFGKGNSLIIIDFKDMMAVAQFEHVLNQVKEGLLR